MKKTIQLTAREEELMNFLWDYGKPLTSNEMRELCTERTWSANYLHVMLRSLSGKGMLESCGLVQYGTQYARQFIPTMTKEQYFVQLAMERGVNQKNFIKFAVASAKSVKRSELPELIDSLEDIIRDLENSKED